MSTAQIDFNRSKEGIAFGKKKAGKRWREERLYPPAQSPESTGNADDSVIILEKLEGEEKGVKAELARDQAGVVTAKTGEPGGNRMLQCNPSEPAERGPPPRQVVSQRRGGVPSKHSFR